MNLLNRESGSSAKERDRQALARASGERLQPVEKRGTLPRKSKVISVGSQVDLPSSEAEEVTICGDHIGDVRAINTLVFYKCFGAKQPQLFTREIEEEVIEIAGLLWIMLYPTCYLYHSRGAACVIISAMVYLVFLFLYLQIRSLFRMKYKLHLKIHTWAGLYMTGIQKVLAQAYQEILHFQAPSLRCQDTVEA